jgi:predicted house-cleaning noncanonical NTP pyrophosphatase (MazG superfamily)
MHIDDERNLQALCFRCNRAKRDQDATDFRLPTQKLVRDKIPQIIIEGGKKPIFESLSGGKFKSKLFEKLTEEHAELISNINIDEIADMIEILLTIAKLEGHGEQEVLSYLYQKRSDRGTFDSGVFLKEILPYNAQ